jgi:hypothetical protein
MSTKLYTIYDRIAGCYGPIFPAANDATASRNAALILSQSDILDVSDYQLYCLADVDDHMHITPLDMSYVVDFVAMYDRMISQMQFREVEHAER